MEISDFCPPSSAQQQPGVFAVVFTSIFSVFLLFDIVGSVSVLWSVASREKKE